MVPFGTHNGIRKGYVIALKDDCDLPPEKIKEIAELPVSDSGYSEDEDGAIMRNLCPIQGRKHFTLSLFVL